MEFNQKFHRFQSIFQILQIVFQIRIKALITWRALPILKTAGYVLVWHLLGLLVVQFNFVMKTSPNPKANVYSSFHFCKTFFCWYFYVFGKKLELVLASLKCRLKRSVDLLEGGQKRWTTVHILNIATGPPPSALHTPCSTFQTVQQSKNFTTYELTTAYQCTKANNIHYAGCRGQSGKNCAMDLAWKCGKVIFSQVQVLLFHQVEPAQFHVQQSEPEQSARPDTIIFSFIKFSEIIDYDETLASSNHQSQT